jgi:hypothetical protein
MRRVNYDYQTTAGYTTTTEVRHSMTTSTAQRLCQRVSALPEPTMRIVVVAEMLRDTPADEAVALVAELLAFGRDRGDLASAVTLAALAGALSDAQLVTYPVRRGIYEAAKEAGHDEVAQLLLAGARHPDEPPPPEPERPLARGGRPLTLGERKSLARGHRRELLVELCRDPDAQVIRVLLENRHITEADIVRVAARRPARGEILRAVFASPWLTRYAVKRALVLNPYTPGELAIRLLPTLKYKDLLEVSRDSSVAEATRAQAERLLRRAGATS